MRSLSQHAGRSTVCRQKPSNVAWQPCVLTHARELRWRCSPVARAFYISLSHRQAATFEERRKICMLWTARSCADHYASSDLKETVEGSKVCEGQSFRLKGH